MTMKLPKNTSTGAGSDIEKEAEDAPVDQSRPYDLNHPWNLSLLARLLVSYSGNS
jgi:hypothetical protein